MLIAAIFQSSVAQKAEVVDKMSNSGSNKFYLTNKAPLQNQYFVKLPVTSIKPGGWVRKALKLQREGLQLAIELQVRKWEKNKNSVSVNYGPLTYSLNIQENYVKKDSKETAIGDSRWQEGADPKKWPSYEIHPASDWNYGLILDEQNPAKSFKVVKKNWPANNNPFTNATSPIEIIATGKKIPTWGIDKYGLVAVLPQSPVTTEEPETALTLVPMGGARLRISAFPVVE